MKGLMYEKDINKKGRFTTTSLFQQRTEIKTLKKIHLLTRTKVAKKSLIHNLCRVVVIFISLFQSLSEEEEEEFFYIFSPLLKRKKKKRKRRKEKKKKEKSCQKTFSFSLAPAKD